MEDSLQQGIAAFKAGNKVRAFELLTHATQDPATAEQGWLWLSAVVTHDSERLFCLDNVLRINRANAAAERGAAMLREKGVFPSVPMPPSSTQPRPANPPVVPAFTSQAAPAPTPQAVAAAAPLPRQQVQPQAPSQAIDANEENLKALYRYTAEALASKLSPKLILKNLTAQGVSPETAETILKETRQLMRKARGKKYQQQMLGGALLAGAGIAVTLITREFAGALGGQYVICYGAIVIGILSFIVGFFGWLFNH